MKRLYVPSSHEQSWVGHVSCLLLFMCFVTLSDLLDALSCLLTVYQDRVWYGVIILHECRSIGCMCIFCISIMFFQACTTFFTSNTFYSLWHDFVPCSFLHFTTFSPVFSCLSHSNMCKAVISPRATFNINYDSFIGYSIIYATRNLRKGPLSPGARMIMVSKHGQHLKKTLFVGSGDVLLSTVDTEQVW